MKKLKFFFATLLLLAVSATARQWTGDILGDGYVATTIDQGIDYSGSVVSTVIKKNAPASCNSHRGVLYIHGYNDYFFQTEMGDRFVDSCYNFYAVDLRKYGRSIRDGQRHYEFRDVKEYYADIDSALSIMRQEGIDDVTLIGHSTGGLVAASYMNESPHPEIKRLILNSPFLEWNMGGFMRRVVLPSVSALGRCFKNMSFSQGSDTSYGESLLRRYHGEWDYDTLWKTVKPNRVTASWIRAISNAQKKLKKKSDISVPILLMHSASSATPSKYDATCQENDIVLNVDDISRIGLKLGPTVTEVSIPGALHDIILSRPTVRDTAYRAIFDWLSH
jgi:alpha-beta hydrolase superfamily lysophospholipase